MKQNTVKTAVCLGVFGLLGILNSQAQLDRGERPKTPPTAAEIIKQMDANKDGKLSLKEVKGPLKDDFSKIDTNEDGFLSKEEIEKAPKPKRPKKNNE
tara:strand:+ start:242053 stop:242346 length:294 start_codon:yes stop_codon:yes gene_type:complete